jgi:hypothetical protein
MVVTNTTFVLEKIFINVFPLKGFFIRILLRKRNPYLTEPDGLATLGHSN